MENLRDLTNSQINMYVNFILPVFIMNNRNLLDHFESRLDILKIENIPNVIYNNPNKLNVLCSTCTL